jgi:hypothetical protein
MWQVNPYHHHKIAVDRSGNVYALGHRIDARPAKNLIVKYSPKGTVIREFLPVDLLPNGQDTVLLNGRVGDNHLWIAGERLRLYVAATQELLEFDLDGVLARRLALGNQLVTLAKAAGGTRAQIRMVPSVDEPQAMFAQLAVWNESTGYSFGVVRLSLDGTAPPRRLEQEADDEPISVPLLGTSDGRFLFLDAKAGALVRR